LITAGSGSALPGKINNCVGSVSLLPSVAASLIVPDSSVMPYEVSAGISGSLPGCNHWVNIPFGATDLCSEEIANRTLAAFPAGRTIYLEYGNEPWNFAQERIYAQAQGMLGCFGYSASVAGFNSDREHIHRAFQHRAIWARVFGSRASEIKLVANIQFFNPLGGPQTTVTYANNYNANHPLAATEPGQIDNLGGAPYIDILTDAACIDLATGNPISIRLAVASLASTHPTSIAFNAANPWTRQGILDYFRHQLKYTQQLNGANGVFAKYNGTVLPSYIACGTQPVGFKPALIGYEGSIETLVPGAIQTGADANGNFLNPRVSHDLQYDPDVYDLNMTLFQVCQQGGMASLCLYSLCQIRYASGSRGNGTFVWGQTTWPGQLAGRGNGSDGKAVNQFWATDGNAHDLQNVSPMLQAAIDWIDRSSPTPPPPQSRARRPK
jgi:hypothetical protein